MMAAVLILEDPQILSRCYRRLAFAVDVVLLFTSPEPLICLAVAGHNR